LKAPVGKAISRAVAAVVEPLEGRMMLTTVVPAIADTFVRNNDYALTNFGASPTLFVKNAASGDTRVAYLKFDLTGVTTINSAVLQLSGSLENNLATPVATGVYGVANSSWIQGNGTIVDSIGDGFDTSNLPPGEITFNNAPAVSSTLIDSATVTRDTFQTYTLNVTAYLQAQLAAGNTIVSLALENLTPTAEETEFLSSNARSNAGAVPELIIDDGNPGPPTAVVSAPDVTTTASTETVTVTYTGAAAIDPSTISSDNILVTPYGGGTPLYVEQATDANPPVATVNAQDGSVTAVYTVDAPGGGWSAQANGNYVVAVQPNSVADVNAVGVSGGFGSFNVSVGDTVAPQAAVTASNVSTAGASTYSFSVTFSDNVAVDSTSLTLADVSLTGPAGPLKITGYTVTPTTNANQIVAQYTAAVPNGAWDYTDNGPYTITVNGNQVFDTAGNALVATTQNFTVAIPVPDTTPPAAVITAPNVTSPGGAGETITVVYTDNVAVMTSTIAAGDLTVTGPGGAALAVSLLKVTGSGKSVTAQYMAAAPGGSWTAAANGAYNISLIAGAVTDTSANPVAAGSASFNVSAAVADTQPPVAKISAPDITAAGGQSQTITVVYTDNVAIQTSSLGLANLSVSGPGGPLTVTKFTQSGSGQTVTATYTVSAPGAGWDATDDGAYNIALNANQVRDTSGNVAAVTFGTFNVNIALPDPSDATFNGGNAVTGSFVAESVNTQPDGKILLVGHQLTASGQSEGVVERLNTDGSLDKTFGASGQVVTPAGKNEWFALMIQGANHFVVAGTDNGNFALARYDFNGNLDPTFGSNGVTLTSFGGVDDTAYAITQTPSGQIVTVGSSNNRFAFARFDANGNIDSTFGEGGRQLFDTGAAVQVLGSVAVLNDGRIVAAGSSGSTIDVVRLTSAGEPDTTFSTDGMIAVAGLSADQTSGADYTVALGLQADGKVLVASQTTSGHFGIVRLNTDGSVDTSFGSNGLATANFGGADEADSIVVQDDTSILVVGTSLQSAQGLTAVAAFDTTGKLITSFGDNGLATFSPATSSTTRELHIGDLVLRAFGSATTDGKLLVGASSSGSTTVSSSLRRIIVPGTTSAPGIKETLLGVFGLVNQKKTTLDVDLGGGRTAVFTLTGGTGTALQAGSDIHVEITDLGAGAALTLTIKGGGVVSFSDITVTGNLKSLKAGLGTLDGTLGVSGSAGKITLGDVPGSVAVVGAVASLTAAAIGGTLSAGGNVGTLKLGAVAGNVNVTGNLKNLTTGDVSGTIYVNGTLYHAKVASVTGSIVAAAQLMSLTAASLTNAKILAGANLGSDGLIGGGGTAADVFGAGVISSLRVLGAIGGSFIGAGVNPTNGTFGDGDDTSAGNSLIKSIFAKGGATTTLFESSAFGIAKLPGKVDPASSPLFIIV
jgi:uncharacterized delta-60 repeat protein